jgi:hypothetical protein
MQRRQFTTNIRSTMRGATMSAELKATSAARRAWSEVIAAAIAGLLSPKPTSPRAARVPLDRWMALRHRKAIARAIAA